MFRSRTARRNHQAQTPAAGARGVAFSPPVPAAAPAPAPTPAPAPASEDYDEIADPDWTPTEVFHDMRQVVIDGDVERTWLEAEAHDWDRTYTRTDVGPGTISYRRGRGGQPFVQSRRDEYGGERVRVDYDDIAAILDEEEPQEVEDEPPVIEQRADDLLNASLGEHVDFSRYPDRWPDRQRRAGALLLGITQVAEEARSEGSALLARAGLQAIADGTATFTSVFGRSRGQYTPAHVGGTQEMREVVSGTRQPDQDLAGLTECVRE